MGRWGDGEVWGVWEVWEVWGVCGERSRGDKEVWGVCGERGEKKISSLSSHTSHPFPSPHLPISRPPTPPACPIPHSPFSAPHSLSPLKIGAKLRMYHRFAKPRLILKLSFVLELVCRQLPFAVDFGH
ncbi:hypothetical protein NSTC745_02027 [Nostoc sp. DSM 114161]|jgi:hypothetical protein